MFKALHAVARHTPLNLIITPAGEALRVIVMPKPTGEAASVGALAKPFSIAGTPEALEAEFPAALARYASAVNEVRAAHDLPLDELEAAKEKAAKKDAAKVEKKAKDDAAAKARSQAAKKAAAKRARRAEEERKKRQAKADERKRAKEAAAKKRRATAAARRTAKPTKSIQLPGAQPINAPEALGRPAAMPEAGAIVPNSSTHRVKHHAGKPGKSQCVADWENLDKKLGERLTRRAFIKAAKTGRRYEKLWKNWEAFVAEAAGRATAQTDQPSSGAAAIPPSEQGADVASLSASAPCAAPEPDDKGDGPEHGRGSGTSTDVYDVELKYLSSITTRPAVGAHIALASQPKLLRVVKIETREGGGLDIIVAPDAEETARRALATADAVRAQAAKRVIPIAVAPQEESA